MKSKIRLFGITAIIAMTGIGVITCENDTTPPHRHDNGYWQTIQEQTCTLDGIMEVRCTGCNEVLETYISSASGHNSYPTGNVTKAATCEEDGIGEFVCMSCGYTEAEGVLPARGHAYSEWFTTVFPGCTETGIESRWCAYDYEHTHEISRILDPTGHGYNDDLWFTVTPATCTEPEVRGRYCTMDLFLGTYTFGSPLGHNYTPWRTTTPATCIAEGWQTRSCLNNGHYQTESQTLAIDPDAHAYSSWVTITTVSCTEAGVQKRTCGNDSSHTDQAVENPLGHAYGSWRTTYANCTTTGKEERTCSRNPDHTETNILPTNDSHAYGDWITVLPPTCTTDGVRESYCSRNTSHIQTKNLSPLGHAYGEWVVATPATCTTNGEQIATCTRDGYKATAAINALGHNLQWEALGEGIGRDVCSRGDLTNDTRLTYKVGDTGPGGGIICYATLGGFYLGSINVNPKAVHYLEAAPADLPALKWASPAFIAPADGGTGIYFHLSTEAEGIGYGMRNTDIILAADPDAPAAKACREYSRGGKTDWFLPSPEEIMMLSAIDSSFSYWSSFSPAYYNNSDGGSVYNTQYATIVYRYPGYRGKTLDKKFYAYAVRPMRAF
jgi:hypothetical protein